MSALLLCASIVLLSFAATAADSPPFNSEVAFNPGISVVVKSDVASLIAFAKTVSTSCAFDITQLNMIGPPRYKVSLPFCDWTREDLEAKMSEFDVQLYSMHDEVLARVKRSRQGFEKLGEWHDASWLDNVTDPKFPNQWHLINSVNIGNDVDVEEVWRAGILGDDVSVGIIDDGVEWNNPDITDNFCWKCSFDLNDEDEDPSPHLDERGSNSHGTRCAGLIGAVSNDVCGIGVAPRSKIGGIRMLGGPITDALESRAYHIGFHRNDIYSCSWGPSDDGHNIDGPHEMTQEAITYAANVGRRGRGALIVVASGNGGFASDSCAFDGYAGSTYTFTIGAVSSADEVPGYSEGCSALLGLAYSGGDYRNYPSSPAITTTDWLLGTGTGCTSSFSGTSASAPLAAGIFSLVLEARPCLLRRDVMWLTALTSRTLPEQQQEEGGFSSENGVGLYHTNRHGFGIISATRLVKAALVWPGVPFLTLFSTDELHAPPDLSSKISANKQLQLHYNVSEADVNNFYLYTVEQVVVSLKVSAPLRGLLSAQLQSPSNSISLIVPPRPTDRTSDDMDFDFNSLHFLGEEALGVWTLTVFYGSGVDAGRERRSLFSMLEGGAELEDSSCEDGGDGCAHFHHWRLTIHGTPLSSEEVRRRMELVDAAMELDIPQLQQLSPNITCSRALVDFGHNEDIMPLYILKTLVWAEFLIGLSAFWIFVEDLMVPLCFSNSNEDEDLPLLPHHTSNNASEGGSPTVCPESVRNLLQKVKSKILGCCREEAVFDEDAFLLE